MPRLMVLAWDIPGVCDIPAMTAAINAHLRRHDTYHSWFEYQDGIAIRHTVEDSGTIDMVPVSRGQMTAPQIQTHLMDTTPEPPEWDCFTFGIIQHAEHFTFYASVDHLHFDGMSTGPIFADIHLGYAGLSQGQPLTLPDAGSYSDYCVRQSEHLASLSLSSPQIQQWIRFAQGTDGAWPSFPLPLGELAGSSRGDVITIELLTDEQAESFESVCRTAGVRFSGGVMACAALAEHELIGSETYHGFTPYDTRIAPTDSMTVGWFASLLPISVPIGTSFADTARAAQKSFDAAKQLAGVPFERVLELGTPEQLGFKLPERPGMMVSFLDARKIPVAALWDAIKCGIYYDSLSLGGINMWVNRLAAKTTLTISFPDNPIARESVERYADALASIYSRVANGDVSVGRTAHFPAGDDVFAKAA